MRVCTSATRTQVGPRQRVSYPRHIRARYSPPVSEATGYPRTLRRHSPSPFSNATSASPISARSPVFEAWLVPAARNEGFGGGRGGRADGRGDGYAWIFMVMVRCASFCRPSDEIVMICKCAMSMSNVGDLKFVLCQVQCINPPAR